MYKYKDIEFITAIILFSVLGFILPLLFWYNVNFINVSISTIFLTFFILIFSAYKLASLAYKNDKSLLELTFYLFVYVWMGIVPYLQCLNDAFAWQGYYDDFTKNYGLLLIIIGIISYEIGIKLGKKVKKLNKINLNSFPKENYLIMLSIIAIIISMILILKFYGFSNIFASRGERVNLGSTVNNLIINNFIKTPIIVCLILCIASWKDQRKKISKNFWLFTIMLLLLIINLIVSNPISNPRYWFGSIFLGLLFICFNRISVMRWTIIILIMLLIIFPYADLFRNSTDVHITIKNISQPLIYKGDYDAYQQILNTIIYVSNNGIVFGKQMLGAFLFFIPRNIWINKPTGSGQFVAEQLGYSYTNLSCPLWAESYINFGILGIIVIFILYGFISCKMQIKYRTLEKDYYSAIKIIFPFFAAYQIFFLRGDLMNGVAYFSFFLLLSILIKGKKPLKEYNLKTNING